MNKTNLRAYSKALVESALNSQIALEIELAVGFAIMVECDNARRLARETMLTVYHNAGWKCDKPGALDWRKINRHITASIALYDFIGQADIDELAQGKKANDLVEAFRPLIKALKVKSVNEVLLACDKVRPPRKPPTVEGVQLKAGHLNLTVPPSATRNDLLAMATKLMDMAMSMFDVHAEPESVEAASGEVVEA